MRRLLLATLLVFMVVAATTQASAQSPDGAPPDENTEPSGLEMYTLEAKVSEVESLRAQGFDILDVRNLDGGLVELDVAMSNQEAAALRGKGKKIGLKRNIRNQSVIEATTIEAENGYNVWRTWSEPDGIRDELLALVDQYPHLLKLTTIGQSVNGQDILAVKLTRDANKVMDGKRPAVLYISAQHAREWITVETNRRLLRYYLSNYNADPEITELIDTTELWFVLVANPDGYDFTFTPGNRLWRKNLADNNGDGQITAVADGVDLNRNFAGRWGYDNEGSSPNVNSATYRGPAPNSEPETQAMDAFMAEVDPVFMLNYHSAAELLLYGVGWQVATPTPDDNIMAPLAGTDQSPAVPGYDPDLSAELYTTNGTTDDQAHGVYGILMYTPELDTCESAEDIFPDDAFGDTYCESEARTGFEFPDDEALIQAVFDKNLEFALNMARSAHDPTNPVTNTGLTAPRMVVDDFSVSHGTSQEVAVETQREYENLRMFYVINGGRQQFDRPVEWEGGERYGDDYDEYYAEYRGTVTGASVGDTVEVWFTARDVKGGNLGPVESEHFTYTVEAAGASVLIVANEDYDGFNPQQPGVVAPAYVDAYADALDANGVSHEVWDVTSQGVPHDLGVLSHYDLVIWELGDNRLSQDAEDVLTSTPFGPLPDLQVKESQQALAVSIRDYLNEGGKLFHAGEYTAFYGFFADALGGAYYGLNGDETADCVITDDFFGNCLIYSNDFAQYYLGVWSRQSFLDPEQVEGEISPFAGTYTIDGSMTPSSGSFTLTSDVLSPAGFPLFASEAAARYSSEGPGPFEPISGDQYAAALHSDSAWMRLSQTVDLTGATSGRVDFKMSYNVEGAYDHVIVEARPAGTGDWTTLPDLNGGTSTQVPAECAAGFFIGLHPDLSNYLTLDGAGCLPTGSTGAWNSFTGDSGGWVDVAVDLSAYAGQEVEVSISYVTDPAAAGIGVFVDEVVVTTDGVAGEVNGFEDGLGDFAVPGPPASSPGNAIDWIVSPALFEPPAAVAVTEDTVTYGFGFEAITTAEQRRAAMAEVLDHLAP